MKKLISPRNIVTAGMVLALVLASAFFAPEASAENGKFNLMVKHLINGSDLGLDKELPVKVFINGGLAIDDFRFGESVSTSLSAGTYTINVTLMDGTPLPSMDVGPVMIPADVDVSIKALLDYEDTPYLNVSISESEAEVSTFKATVRHSINGRSLGLPKALPVNVFINGGLAIPGFEFGDKVVTELPAGTYTITVELLDGTLLSSMTVGPVDVDAGADLIFNAKLDANKTPVIQVVSR
jgi:hypothetical protein